MIRKMIILPNGVKNPMANPFVLGATIIPQLPRPGLAIAEDKGSSWYSFFDHGWCWSQILQLTWDCWSFMNTGGEETNKYVCDNCTKYVCSERVVIVLKGFFTFNVRRITLFDNSLYEPFFSRLLLILNSIKRI